MKAEDIRKLNTCLQEVGLRTTSATAHDAGLKSLELSLLTEIAAQFAEANEHLACIAHPVMTVNTESHWVAFSDGKTKIVIDRRGVTGVRRSGPEVEMESQVDTPNAHYVVNGTVAEVCAKLGIPVQ